MKFTFSIGLLIIFYLIPIEAKEVILFSYHPSQSKMSQTLKKIMHENMDFPEELVEFIESEEPCKRKEVSAAHICIKENGEMDFPIIYTETMKETLGVFWSEFKDELKEK